MKYLNFFTPVIYQNHSRSEKNYFSINVDNYFYLGGKRALVIQGRTKNGHQKVILSETEISLLERIAKVVSYFTIIIPLIMLVIKAALRSKYNFKVVTHLNFQKKLEKGISVTQESITKIQSLMPIILNHKKHKDIEWLEKSPNLIFKLSDMPNIIYEMARPDLNDEQNSERAIDQCFDNMIQAKQECIINDLDLLELPSAKKIEVKVNEKTYKIIAKKALDFNPNESANEELYRKYSTDLNETMRQLAIFVAKTNFNKVTIKHMPILKKSLGSHGSKSIALIDLLDRNSASNYFPSGNNNLCSLIRCLSSERQIKIVLAEARKQKILLNEEKVNEAVNTRLREILEDNKLHAFHASRSITTGKEPINVDVDSLDLNFDQTARTWVTKYINVGLIDEEEVMARQTITLRQATESVISELNRLIQTSSNQSSNKAKRYLLLNSNENPWASYSKIPDKFCRNEGQSWLDSIILALVSKGHLFKLDKVNGHGYFIQA